MSIFAPAVRSSFTVRKPHPGRQPSPKPISDGLFLAVTADIKCCLTPGSFRGKKKKKTETPLGIANREDSMQGADYKVERAERVNQKNEGI